MSKRFSDTDKWKKVWFRELKPVHKCFWEYIRDNCNNAGIWDVDFKLASFQIGAKLNQTEIEQVFEKQFIKVNSNKWFLTDFIEWQYNCSISELNPKNNAHLSALRILDKFNIKGLIEGLVRAQSAPMDKDKDKDKVKNKDIALKFDSKILEVVAEFYDYKIQQYPKELKEWVSDKDRLLYDSCSVIDKLVRLDGYMIGEVVLVLKNTFKDSFWSENIISLRGLRNKSKNGQMKFQNAAVKLLKKDVWAEIKQRAEEADRNETL